MAMRDGFFDAIYTEQEDPETGEVVNMPDRTYSPEDFNKYFEGILGHSGIFYLVGDAMAVSVATKTQEEIESHPSQFKIKIGTGMARVNNHWLKISTPEYLWVNYGSAEGPRYDAIVARWDNTNRNITLMVIEGTPMESMPKPSIYQPAYDEIENYYDILLCYIRIPQNLTAMSSTNIYDYRGTSYCPWITHMIWKDDSQATTIELLDAYLKHYHDIIVDWMTSITDSLEVNTSLRSFIGTVTGGTNTSNTIRLESLLTDYKFNEGDVFDIFYNGLLLTKDTEYTISSDGNLILSGQSLSEGNELVVRVIKSQVGLPTYTDGDNIKY